MTTARAMNVVRERMVGISDLYYRLLLVVGPSGCGKTATLRALGEAEEAPVMPLSARISERLLDLTERQRVLQLPTILEEEVASLPQEMTLLDNTEVLFAAVLKQDPLRLLRRISRNRTVVASWLGSVIGGHLTYASSDHPEFRRYPTEDLLIVTLNDSTEQAAQG
jgi:ABC-type dipeptide/oligopeptide/nickel transport system ATPase component